MANADGSIVINATVDDKQAEKKLESLNKKIDSTEKQISKLQAAKLPLVEEAKRLGAELDAAKAKLEYMQSGNEFFTGAQIKEQADAAAKTQKAWDASNASISSVDRKIQNATSSLREAQMEAGELDAKMASVGYKTTVAMEEASDRVEKFTKRMKNLVKRVFVFSVFTLALRGTREWLAKVIQTNDEAVSSIARLKGSFLTLAQPLVSVVVPAFSFFLDVLTDIVATAAQIVSWLFGTTVEESANAAESLNKEAEALGAVGKNAKKAGKNLAAFDEINKLTDTTSGGVASLISPDFSGLKNGILSSLTFSLEDILFDWSDLSAEDVIAKLVVALTTAVGGVIGFKVGGYGGAALGAIIGTGVGLAITNLLFNGDGDLDGKELLNSLSIALGAIAGGIIGFKTTGSLYGAAIGVVVGAGVTLAIVGLMFNGDGQISKSEIASLLAAALGAMVGGIIGFAVGGGATGALVGATIGANVFVKLTQMELTGEYAGNENKVLADLATALAAVVGGVIGFRVGGPLGAVLGAAVGASIGLMITHATIYAENESNGDALLRQVTTVLAAICGGAIGFAAGGPAGAVIGMIIGAGIALAVKDVSFSNETANKKVGYKEGKEIGDNAIDGARDSLGVHSPSTEFEEIGTNMVLGMFNGITKHDRIITAAFTNLLNSLTDEFDVWEISFDSRVALFRAGFMEIWGDMWIAARVQFINSWNNILRDLQSGINNAVSAINKMVSEANAVAGITGSRFGFANRIFVDRVPVPALARGAVIPPNREFLAVLGDQRSGNNIETPEALLRKIVREEGGSGMSEALLRDILDAIRSGHVIAVDGKTLAQVTKKGLANNARASGT